MLECFQENTALCIAGASLFLANVPLVAPIVRSHIACNKKFKAEGGEEKFKQERIRYAEMQWRKARASKNPKVI